MRRRLLTLVTSLLLAATTPAGETVVVGAAANLTFVLDALQKDFNAVAPDVRLTVVLGSSGSLLAQILQGAPYDVFLSADPLYAEKLAAAGQAAGDGPASFAHGALALWQPAAAAPLASIEQVVRDPQLRRLALAAPAHAPYGRAAREVLQRLNLWTLAEPRCVYGENVAQAAQFVQSGHADAGFVPLSLLHATSAPRGHWVMVPPHLHAPLDHVALVTRRGGDNPGAPRFVRYLTSPRAREILRHAGYVPPPER